MVNRVPKGGEDFSEDEWNSFRSLAYDVARMVDLSPPDAADIAQATMVSLLTFLKKGGHVDRPEGWLFRVALRRSYDLMRNKDRRYSVPSAVLPDKVEAFEDQYERVVHQITADNVARDIPLFAKAKLSQQQFVALLDLYLHNGGKGPVIDQLIEVVAEAAQRPSSNINTQKTHLTRAKKRINEEFSRNEDQA